MRSALAIFPRGTSWRRLTRRALVGGTTVVVGTPAAACGSRSGRGGEAGSTGLARLGPQGFWFERSVAITYWKSLEGPRHDAIVEVPQAPTAIEEGLRQVLVERPR
jgi:hypothetical protein